MKQIIADTLKQYLKEELEDNGFRKCTFQFPLREPGVLYCHFLADPEVCKSWGEERHIDYIPGRDTFYTCNLRKGKP
jgi:hypothetical protein